MKTKDKKIIEDAKREGIPIFVLTAKDVLSIYALKEYEAICESADCKPEFIHAIVDRIKEFDKWQKENADKVKLPD